MQTLVLSPTSLGRALRDVRLAKKLTQGQLAERAGTTQPTISSIERGISSVSLDTLLRILAALRFELILQSRQEPANARGDLDA